MVQIRLPAARHRCLDY